MNILIATNHLDKMGGSESFTYTLIEELIKRDHTIEYFTFIKGFVSDKIENELKVNFMSKDKYDLILANHKSCVNFLYSKGFLIQTCHGIYPELEQPSVFADAYVAISEEVQNYLYKFGCQSKLIWNGINTERFSSKQNINNTVKRILSLSQSQEVNLLIERICKNTQIDFLYLNKFDNPIWEVEEEINKADLVIGIGRSAYEAMSCGRAVLIYDHRPYSDPFGDGYITNVLTSSIRNNCSGRFYKLDFSEEQLENEILKYNANDGKVLRKFIIDNMDITKTVNEYISYYLLLEENRENIKFNLNFDFLSKFLNKKYARKIVKRINKDLYRERVL